jgi:pimeloyl-ACP methyl ester carboxylesterase
MPTALLPVRKYKALADAYGFILVGSNNSKNGNDWPTTENIWRSLSDDTRDRLRLDVRRTYLCGFSGGAKAASYIAIQHPGIAGVIAGGAGLPDGVSAGDFNFSYTVIAGQGDMNLTELVGVNGELDKTRTPHRIIFFDGKHEWSPVNTMALAFDGLRFDAMKSSLIPKDNAFINTYIAGAGKN